MRSFATVDERLALAPPAGRRTVVLLALLALTALLSVVAWSWAPHLDDIVRPPPEGEAARVQREVSAEFGTQNPVVWVVAARHGSVWNRASLEKLRDLTRQAFTVPGVIAPEVMSIASPNVRDLHASAEKLEPTYLMAEVPATPGDVDALRRRVEQDPNLRGNLVSTDGRAALVVADFLPAADPHAVAAAALAIRDRLRDERTDVYVAGAPILRQELARIAPWLAVTIAAVAAVGMLVLALGGGPLFLATTLAAVLFALLWAGGALVLAGRVTLPWSTYAAPPVALLASALVATAAERSRRLAVAAAFSSGFAVVALVAAAPVKELGMAGALGAVTAAAAAEVLRWLAGERRLARAAGKGVALPPVLAWTRRSAGSLPYRLTAVPVRGKRSAGVVALLVLAAIACVGAARLHSSFGASGYAERYLPDVVAHDLRAIVRHFPPPTALALRVRGAPGFVKSPQVLAAFEGVTDALETDPAVRHAMSLADLVKTVHRAFNENDPAYDVIPDDAAMVGRYLALAYSPGFRRFVNRSFAAAVIWVYVDGDAAADLTRVRAEIDAQLDARPIPGASVDALAGDGAAVLASAALASRLEWAAAVLTLAAVLCLAALAGAADAGRALLGAALAFALTAAAFGLGGVAVDFVSLPFLIAGALGGLLLSLLAQPRAFRLALIVGGLACIVASMAAGTLIGVVAGAPLLAAVVGAAASRKGWTRP